MRISIIILLVFLYSNLASQDAIDAFKLSFVYIGLGSNYNTKQPVFEIENNEFIYTLQETSSWNGELTMDPDTLVAGKVNRNSIASIIEVLDKLEERNIYRISEDMIMSGGVHLIEMEYKQSKYKIELDNVSHPVAEEIVEILNKLLPKNVLKLSLFSS